MTHVSRGDARYVTCVRCPQRFLQWAGRRKQELCGDCRYVVSEVERDMWEAA